MKSTFICNTPHEFSELTHTYITITFSSTEITPDKLKQIINRIHSCCLFEFDEVCKKSGDVLHVIVENFWLLYNTTNLIYSKDSSEKTTVCFPLLPVDKSALFRELFIKYDTPNIISKKFTLSFEYIKEDMLDYIVTVL